MNECSTPTTDTDQVTVSAGRVRDARLVVVEVSVQLVILCAAIIGNVLVLVVVLALVRRRRRRHTPTNTPPLSRMNRMIVHLSTADLFVAFFNVLPQLLWDITGTFRGNDLLCRAVTYLQLVAMYASSYVLVATAVDRYLAICRPLNALRRRAADRLVGGAWLLALVFALPQLAVFGYREADEGGHDDCWAVFDPAWSLRVYITWTTLAIYVGPAAILAVSYTRICFAVIRSIRQRQAAAAAPPPAASRCHGNVTSSTSAVTSRSLASTSTVSREAGGRGRPARSMSAAKVRTIKLTVIVNVSYLFCWAPFFISHVWAAYDSSAPFEGTLRTQSVPPARAYAGLQQQPVFRFDVHKRTQILPTASQQCINYLYEKS